jgi:outer membrane receptor for ferrienterochelin and colicins
MAYMMFTLCLRLAVATSLLAMAMAPHAQTAPAQPLPRPAPVDESAPEADAQRVEVTGNRPGDAEQRRRATAAKIVIGRDEIERYGDSTTSEVLKRLAGITMPGPAGRGGNPRMRGMAGNYTQILLDGERIPPGFSLDSIAPEQIERIEILRAPTAETGARAIAGTINIVLREGFRKRLNDLRVGVGIEDGQASPNLNWTRNDTVGDWIVNLSLSAFRRTQDSLVDSQTLREDIASSVTTSLTQTEAASRETRSGLNASGRLQWRSQGDVGVALQPLVILSQGNTAGQSNVDEIVIDPVNPSGFVHSQTQSDGSFALLRLNGQVNQRLDANTRLEWRFGLGEGHWRNSTLRDEFAADGTVNRHVDDSTDNRDRSASLSLKASRDLEGGHSLVSGVETEYRRRVDAHTTLWNGVPQLTEFGDSATAASGRLAIYAQDEWSITPHWAAHAGLRFEGITTEGEGANDVVERNYSRVATPLLHAVWRPDPNSRDQVRASLTRSYNSPNLNQLIGRPALNNTNPPPGTNTELSADRAGNPALRPEVALGIDLAVERYLPEDGVLSANLFARRISDLIRNVVTLEDVSWSPGVPRYVSRPQNIGSADSQGVELEAKFRLSDVIDDAPRVDVRSNLSLFRSYVQTIPSPDNRLAEQPGGTFNLGADYRLRSVPLTLGGNVNYTPGYSVRLDLDRWATQPDKTVVDAYALWVFNLALQLRLSLGNALAQDYLVQTRVESSGQRESVAANTRSYVNWQLRLEMKL